jgi:hypothetical protein
VADLKKYLADQGGSGVPAQIMPSTPATEQRGAETASAYSGRWNGLFVVTSCSEATLLALCETLRTMPVRGTLVLVQQGRDVSAALAFGNRSATLNGVIDERGQLNLSDHELAGPPPRTFVNNWNSALRPVGATMTGSFVWNIGNAVFATYELRNFQKLSE